MKKIKYLAMFAMLMVMAVCSAYSQNANGAELLQKGKDYEAKKEYVYALGSYYDAIVAGGESAAEALNAFNTLAGYIREGNPGPGKYNEFTLHDGWVALLQNAEKYWTENCPWQFMFKIGNKTVDYATRTASYTLEIDATFGWYESKIAKYGVIVDETIFKGLDKAWKKDWTDIKWNNRDKTDNWPYMSVYQKPQGKYLQNGSGLFDVEGLITCAWKLGIDEQIRFSLYDMKVAICDLSGKELLKTERILYGKENKKYTFTGVSPDVMDMIDNKQITIKITDLYLEYGKYNKADDKGGRTFIKNLPELKLNVTTENAIAYSLLSPDETVTIPYSIYSSGRSKEFVQENKLTKIKIPFTITPIKELSNCDSLTSVNIPYGIMSIGDGAFYGCSSLTSVTIPNSVTSIGDIAFFGCKSLTSVTIPDSVTSIGASAFSGCDSLTSVTIPNSVTSIGARAFSGCKSLTSVTIPDSVTSIKYEVFHLCSSLTSVAIPDSVTSIEHVAFRSCDSLTSVTIPNSVTSMDDNSFDDYVTVTYRGTTDTWKNIYYKVFLGN